MPTRLIPLSSARASRGMSRVVDVSSSSITDGPSFCTSSKQLKKAKTIHLYTECRYKNVMSQVRARDIAGPNCLCLLGQNQATAVANFANETCPHQYLPVQIIHPTMCCLPGCLHHWQSLQGIKSWNACSEKPLWARPFVCVVYLRPS